MDQFDKKHGEEAIPLEKGNCRLVTKAGQHISSDAIIEASIKEGDELYVRRGKDNSAATAGKPKSVTTPSTATPPASTAPSSDKSAVDSGNTIPCKRFGCGKRFIPGQPSADPCRHHKKPPVFHETRKYWACCPDKVAWDWDSFQAIAGCEELPEHSNENAAGAKKVMGGTELRAEIHGPREIGVEKKLTGLDRLLALRQGLIGAGMKAEVFDNAQNAIKRLHEDQEGKNIWDRVCSEMTSVFEETLNKVASSSSQN